MFVSFVGHGGSHPGVKPRRSERGITLVQILVVVGVIGLLIMLLLPATRTARPVARRLQCASNLKQISLGLQNYEQAYHCFPPAWTEDAAGRRLHSWRTLILPYMDEEALYQTIDLTKPWNAPQNAQALARMPRIYRCPESNQSESTTSYLAVVGPELAWKGAEPRRLDEFTDGTSNTIQVIEADAARAVPWMAPEDGDEAWVMGLGPKSKLNHNGGFNAIFADGAARFMSYSMDASIRRSLLTVSGHEKLIADDW